jgi:polar amino acid transport system permease protein
MEWPWRSLLSGLWVTIEVFVGAAALALPCAAISGTSTFLGTRWQRLLGDAYVLVFRGTSALVQLFWVYFGLPLLGVDVDALAASILVLGLNTGAYGSVLVHAALADVPAAQWEAARALGLSRSRTLLHVVVPQALPLALPPATNLLIELLKATALVSLVTLSDLTFEARLWRDQTLRSLEGFGAVLLLYFCLASGLARAMRALEDRVALPKAEHGPSRL